MSPYSEQYWKNPEYWREKTREYSRKHPEWKKKFDREYAEKNRQRISEYQRLWALARHRQSREKFGDKCYACGKQGGKLSFHHISYPNGKSKQWLPRIREVEQHPENFRLLCPSCHSMITILSQRKERIPKLLEVLRDMGIKV